MKISEMIAQLEAMKEKHGDLPIMLMKEFYDCDEAKKISTYLSKFEDMSWEEYKQMEIMGMVNSVIISNSFCEE